MKKILVILFLSLFTEVIYAQISNSERLVQIETELKRAVDNGNFEEAAKLKKERDLRLEIEEAIKSGDFDKAASLKSQLNEGKGRQQSNETKTNQTVQKEAASTPASDSKVTSDKPGRTISNGFYFEMIFGSVAYSGGPSDLGRYVSFVGPAFGLTLGNKFYFSDPDKSLRFGLDVQWLASNIGFHALPTGSAIHAHYGILNPGFGVAKAFNRKIGLEASFVMGPALVTYLPPSDVLPVETYPTGTGMRFSPQVKFKFGLLGAGMGYSFAKDFNHGATSNLFGFIIGMKF